MAEGDEKKSTIIIVKKKGGHAGAHGGAWKIAYADLVTAMMAFFLLMWLLNNVTQETKKALSDYFKEFSVFDNAGSKAIAKETPMATKPGEEGKNKKKNTIELPPEPDPQKGELMDMMGKMTPKEFKRDLEKKIQEQLGDIKNQVKIDITEDGVRIQLVDKDGKDMFQAGNSEPSDICKRALKVLADSFKSLPNPVAVEGHTDSVGRNDGPGGNWNLSTKRALSAREMLETSGVDANQFDRVTGKADMDPLVPDDPENSQNRRVAITLLFQKPKHLPGEAEDEDEAPPEHGGAGSEAPKHE